MNTRMRAALFAMLVCTSSACAPMYIGQSETRRADALEAEPGWTAVEGVPQLRQETELDCGPVALAMVQGFWEPSTDADRAVLRDRISAGALRDAARAHGYQAFLVEGTLNDIEHELLKRRPMIVGMAKDTTDGALGHYEVVVGMHRERQLIATFDPALGARQYSFEDFLREWIGAGRPLLVVIGPPSEPLRESVLEPVAGLEDPSDHEEANGREAQRHAQADGHAHVRDPVEAPAEAVDQVHDRVEQ